LNPSTAQVSIEKRERIQLGSSQINITQVGTTKINLNQAAVTQLGMTEIGVSEQSLLQLNLGQVNTSQIQLREIQPSTPTIIQIQQFPTVHNLNLQNTTIPTWTDFLTGTTPFNLNIEITDLPTGQLAEANITGFDSNGHPTTGTLTLDLDANGLGWFIDPTPWDNTEFAPQNSDTFFRATPGSEAYGHYDLLTTILHVREAFALANTRPPRRPHQRQPHLRQPHPNQPFGKQ
jgi:hypothetical protein